MTTNSRRGLDIMKMNLNSINWFYYIYSEVF